MEASSVLSSPFPKTSSRVFYAESKATLHFPLRRNCKITWVQNARRTRRTSITATIYDVQTVLDRAPVQVTWQIVVGAIAGVTPFVVAGVEFSKRIIAQKRCEECGGSGLVLREKEYFRCPECVLLVNPIQLRFKPMNDESGKEITLNFKTRMQSA